LFGEGNIEQLRIDHNTFSLGASQIGILLGETGSTGAVWGVIDHNTFTAANNFMGVKVLSGGTNWVTGRRGTPYNVFVEDNTFNFTNNGDLGSGGIDAWRASSVVFRFNNMLNTRYVNHSLCHGGPMSVEVYGNTVSSPTGSPAQYRNIHFQGSGEIIVFDNIVGGTSAGHIALQHYRSEASQLPQGECTAVEVCDGDWTAASGIPLGDGNRSGQAGYPCWHQPGRDGAGTLRPVYFWQNRNANGAKVSVRIETGGNINNHLRVNRDYYEAVSASPQTSPTNPFNGTAGVGFGTLANRPTTCSTNADPADAGRGGVAYWATDQGEWNSSNPGPDGQLYICSAPNTWTLYYAPYTYPHPLVDGATPAPPPQPPSNLTITSSR
jgi:hypothetical protein